MSFLIACLASTVWVSMIFFLPETLRARVGDGELYSAFHKVFVWPPKAFSPLAAKENRGPYPPKPSLKMYWKLLSYLPICIVSLNTALLYSTYFCISVVLPTALKEEYSWNTTAIGFGFLAIGIAMVVGSLAGGRFSDFRRRRRVIRLIESLQSSDSNLGDEEKARKKLSVVSLSPNEEAHISPETRLEDQIWGVLVCAIGCVMFGWLVHFRVHPAVVLVATFLNGFGMSNVFIMTTAFLTEAVPRQAALSFALGNMLRNPGAAVGAILAPSLVQKMGWGWFFTGLGILDIILIGGSVLWLRVKGEEWRRKKSEESTKD